MIDADALSASGLEIDEAHGRDLAVASLAIARRFAAGATMWCIAPSWPEHARHVAVEFVHPVIVGKRALPTVAINGPQLVADLRPVVRAGDVLCAISTVDEPLVVDALRRAPGWGLETLWSGWGARPPAGAADHVLFVDGRDGWPPYDGSLVLRYHVLWELTHVSFEHPGLVRAPRDPNEGPDAWITCADEGRVAEVITGVARGDAMVRTARGLEAVDVSLVGSVETGDLLLVHAGAAIALLDMERNCG